MPKWPSTSAPPTLALRPLFLLQTESQLLLLSQCLCQIQGIMKTVLHHHKEHWLRRWLLRRWSSWLCLLATFSLPTNTSNHHPLQCYHRNMSRQLWYKRIRTWTQLFRLKISPHRKAQLWKMFKMVRAKGERKELQGSRKKRGDQKSILTKKKTKKKSDDWWRDLW